VSQLSIDRRTPNVVEALLGGRTEQVPMLERLERSLPASWEEQRDMIVND
jgi:hypothetical protein